MPGSHRVIVDPPLQKQINIAGQQIAGLVDILEGARLSIQSMDLGADRSGGIIVYTPKRQRGYLEPAPVCSTALLHIRIDHAYATIIGIFISDIKRTWGIGPKVGVSVINTD